MIRLQMLGSIGLVGEDGKEVRAVLAQPKRIGLLAYLALAEPDAFLRRDTLLALFWPELGDEEARRALRQALHFLRQHLGQDVIENRGDDVAISRALVTCDVWDLTRCLRNGEDSTAIDGYRGDLLAGFHVSGVSPDFDQWLEGRRSELRRDALKAARRSAASALREGKSDRAERMARFAATSEEAEENDVLRLLEMLRAAGEGTAALAAYDSYARRIRDRYETVPGPALQALVATIRADKATIPVVAAESRAHEVPGAVPSARKHAVRWLVSLAALVAVVFVVRSAIRRSATTRSVPPIVAVAILANRTGDSTLDRLGVLAAEWITRGLTRAPRIQVLDLNVLYTRGRGRTGELVDPMTLARLSKAAFVIGGAYYRVRGDSLRFAAEVIDGNSGQIIRSVDSILGPVADPIPSVGSLGNRLASAVQSIIDPRATLIDAPAQPPPKYEAFQEFVIGQEAFWSGEYPTALDHTLRATRLDSTFAMAAVYATVMSVNLNRCDLVDSITRALQSRIESINEFERTTLGMSSVRCDRNWPEGVRLQRRRLELQPHSAVVKWTAAMTHSLANRQEEAVELFAQINPLRDLAWLGQGRGNYYMSEASAHHLLGDYGAEQEVGRKAAGDVEEKLGPTFIMVRSAAGRGDTVALLSALSGLSAPGPPPPPTFLAANRLDDWIPSIHWVRAQAAAELAAHGHEGEARRVAIEGVTLLRASSDDSTAAVNQYALARMLLVADSAAAAKAVFAGLVAADSANIRFQGFLGAAAARSGDSATAGAILAWLAQHQGTRPPGLTQYYVAAIETNRGNRSLALDLIEKLPYGSHPNDVMEFHVDPMLAPLRAEARFQRFIRPR